jgi:hypothetical protein
MQLKNTRARSNVWCIGTPLAALVLAILLFAFVSTPHADYGHHKQSSLDQHQLSGVSPRSFMTDLSAAQVADKEEALLQYTSASGHVVGFGNGAVYVAAMDHMLRVDLVGALDVAPISQGGETQEAGDASDISQPLSRVTYPEAWEGVTVVYEGSAGSILKSSYYISGYATTGPCVWTTRGIWSSPMRQER